MTGGFNGGHVYIMGEGGEDRVACFYIVDGLPRVCLGLELTTADTNNGSDYPLTMSRPLISPWIIVICSNLIPCRVMLS